MESKVKVSDNLTNLILLSVKSNKSSGYNGYEMLDATVNTRAPCMSTKAFMNSPINLT